MKGLGATEGPAIAHVWTPPSLLPELLPWLAVLCLLLLKPNRTAEAWWIWLPVFAILGVQWGARTALDGSLPSQFLELFCQVPRALVFGLAAIWLASPFLAGATRFHTFFKLLPVYAGFTLVAHIGGQDWVTGGEAVAALIYLGVFVLVFAIALILAGRNCRDRFHPVRFSLCLLGWMTAGFVAVLLPFAVFALIAQGAQMWAPFGIAILASTAVQMVISFPFLLLSFTNHFYRARLRQLLGQENPGVPPVFTTEMPTPTAVT